MMISWFMSVKFSFVSKHPISIWKVELWEVKFESKLTVIAGGIVFDNEQLPIFVIKLVI